MTAATNEFRVMTSGAFVAGLDAGMIYNTFPLMDGGFAPSDLLLLEPWWRNPLENVATIQFDHRWAAMLTAAAIFWLWLRGRPAPLEAGQARALDWLALLAATQIALGVATLLTVVWIPLAALHQATALLLFLAAVWTVWSFRGHAPSP